MESVIYGLLGDLFSLKIVMAGENLEKMQKNVFVCLHKNPSNSATQHQAQEPPPPSSRRRTKTHATSLCESINIQ